MPSVHCAWALWCACVAGAAGAPALGEGPVRRSTRSARSSAIVLTGNHYFLDAVGGFAVLGIGYAVSRTFTRAGRGRPVQTTA